MWIIRLNKTKTQFPVGVDCIFHLRGTPYSRWTFLMLFSFLKKKKFRGLAADYPIPRIITPSRTWGPHNFFKLWVVSWALRASPNSLTISATFQFSQKFLYHIISFIVDERAKLFLHNMILLTVGPLIFFFF